MIKSKLAVVTKSTGSWYHVREENSLETIICRLKGKIRLEGSKATNPVAVGDIVTIQKTEEDWVIDSIQSRKNYIVRKSVNLSKQKHIIAANIDRALLVVTLIHPETSLSFMDRFLVSAEAYGIPTTILINKSDLYNEDQLLEAAYRKSMYSSIGYPTYLISVEKQEGINKVKDLIKDQTIVIAGHSGVGKSSLLNTLNPNLDLKTKEISTRYETGKHTTTFAQMYSLENNTHLIDTPGVKSFGIIDLKKEEIKNFFPEFVANMNKCRFDNCIHVNEPKCFIKDAIEEGKISIDRYNSYLSLLEDEEEHFRKNKYE